MHIFPLVLSADGLFVLTHCGPLSRAQKSRAVSCWLILCLADFVFAKSVQLLKLVYKYKKSGVDLWRCTRADMAEQSCIDAAVIAEYALKSLKTGQESKIL